MPLYEIKLKELRKRARLTLVELAERTGVSKSALSKINQTWQQCEAEHRQKNPSA